MKYTILIIFVLFIMNTSAFGLDDIPEGFEEAMREKQKQAENAKIETVIESSLWIQTK